MPNNTIIQIILRIVAMVPHFIKINNNFGQQKSIEGKRFSSYCNCSESIPLFRSYIVR